MSIHHRISSILVIAGLCAIESIVGARQFPASKFERCQAGDTTCLAAKMTKVIQSNYQGLPEIALAPIDPYHFGDVFLSRSGDGPARNMQFNVTEGDVIGWRHMTISNVVGFDKDLKTSKFEFVATVPLETIVGKYIIHGTLLLFPLQGMGNLNITHYDMQMSVRLETGVVTRDDEEYLDIRKVHMELSCKTVVYELGFNHPEINNGLLASVNAGLNVNPQHVFDLTRESQAVARSGFFQKYLTFFFDRLPYRMLFAE